MGYEIFIYRKEMKRIMTSIRWIDFLKGREWVITQVIQKYFKGYFRTFVELELIDLREYYIKNKNMMLFEKYREDQMNTYKELGYRISDYSIHFCFSQVNAYHNEAHAILLIDLEYHYKHEKTVDSALYHIYCRCKLYRKGIKWKMNRIEFELDEFQEFKRQVEQREKQGVSMKQAVFEVCRIRTQGRKKIKEAIERSTQRGIYNHQNGKAYALRFAEAAIHDRFFYTAKGADCTNFVSQCVWAAYGGYDDNRDDVTKLNIKNKVKMTPNRWYGNTGGGTLSWESVEGFYQYCKDTSKIYGPKAQIYGDSKAYKISPFGILVGDVLQIRKGPSGRYGHSVYVTINNNNGSYEGIMVCQHSSDKKNRSLLDVIQKWGGQDCYIRGFRFYDAKFNK